MSTKINFKFSVGKNGILEKLLEITDKNKMVLDSEQFNTERTMRFLKARISNFKDSALDRKYKKIGETSELYTSPPSITLSYKISNFNSKGSYGGGL